MARGEGSGQETGIRASEMRVASSDVRARLQASIKEHTAVDQAITALKNAGGEVYVVGGAVRDSVRGVTPKDVDLMVRGIPENRFRHIFAPLAGHAQITGKDFGVWRYHHPDGTEVEVALPRTERSTGDGHKDFEVQTDHRLRLEDDLLRRDFTINAMAYDPTTHQIIDPHHGERDLHDGVLRTVTEASLSEDPLRILRGVVAHARFNLTPTEVCERQMKTYADRLAHLSRERIQEEMDKLFKTDNPAKGLQLMETIGARPFVFKNEGNIDRVVALDQSASGDLRLAAYLAGQDGKSLRRELHKLHYPVKRYEYVGHLNNHFRDALPTNELEARQYIHNIQRDYVEDVLALREADDKQAHPQARALVASQMNQPLFLKDLAVSGNDLMQAGLKEGPELGKALKQLLAEVLKDPSQNSSENLLALATNSKG